MESLIKSESKSKGSLRVWRQQAMEARQFAGVFAAERRIWTVSSSGR